MKKNIIGPEPPLYQLVTETVLATWTGLVRVRPERNSANLMQNASYFEKKLTYGSTNLAYIGLKYTDLLLLAIL